MPHLQAVKTYPWDLPRVLHRLTHRCCHKAFAGLVLTTQFPTGLDQYVQRMIPRALTRQLPLCSMTFSAFSRHFTFLSPDASSFKLYACTYLPSQPWTIRNADQLLQASRAVIPATSSSLAAWMVVDSWALVGLTLDIKITSSFKMVVDILNKIELFLVALLFKFGHPLLLHALDDWLCCHISATSDLFQMVQPLTHFILVLSLWLLSSFLLMPNGSLKKRKENRCNKYQSPTVVVHQHWMSMWSYLALLYQHLVMCRRVTSLHPEGADFLYNSQCSAARYMYIPRQDLQNNNSTWHMAGRSKNSLIQQFCCYRLWLIAHPLLFILPS